MPADGSLAPRGPGTLGARQRIVPWPGIDWLLCCAGLTGLEFLQLAQTPAAYTFAGTSAICALRQPRRILAALRGGGALWLYVALCLASVLWSPVPETSLRGALQVALTIGSSLVIAEALPAGSLFTAIMIALLAATLASIPNPHMTWNAGALAMTGIFGSKNQFGLSQALLMMVSTWIALDAKRSIIVRGAALLAAAMGFALSFAGRSVDSIAFAVVALGCSYFVFKLNSFPSRWRPIVACTVTAMALLLLAVLVLAASSADMFDRSLQLFGKDATLSGRTVLWDRATKMIGENPLFGTGLQGFWVEGNPYAEELWARFQPGRTGFNFHNLWFEMGVQFGYPGIVIAFCILAGTSASVLRWALRSPTPTSCFFLAFVIFADVRTFVESELLSQFSLLTLLLAVARVYARRGRKQWT